MELNYMRTGGETLKILSLHASRANTYFLNSESTKYHLNSKVYRQKMAFNVIRS